ncbi:glycosyltransferase family 1 protein [Sinomonas sp. ASV486]|uniref:glycosyltransferase family 4 protein n=1 Tax=Sinomonas sp. ASV486 TaxID=3051170 RepID=UPI0027DD4462|nr:glycosyltransferase family 1 protein [Sinomonas sp. ASV486]MDQ4489091.1 glycosyltransferase family 1 protein [Sinomonas sp. ASV486]
MRIAIVAESFLPQMNGVTHSILRILDHLQERGDDVLVIAPSGEGASGVFPVTETVNSARVVRMPAFPMAGYPHVRVAFGAVPKVRRILRDFKPDVVHLASPFELGWRGVRAAKQLHVPTVAVYQTEVPGYAARYGVPFLESWAWQRVENIHRLADRTLAPSTFAVEQLRKHGIPRIEMWRRGVDTARFNPGRRDDAWRESVAGTNADGSPVKVIGYVGRLAAEKQVEDLRVLMDLPGTRLVIVGDGPMRAQLEAQLPRAHFAGFQGGDDLPRLLASFDLFVHPGEFETFCQTIQEAMACGVPVVATGRGGPLDLVENGKTGWLYTPGDLDQMREYVQGLLDDDAMRAAFAGAAWQSVQGRSWKAICDQLINHYEDVISLRAKSIAG